MTLTAGALVSGEGVALDLPTAGVGTRLLAAVVDVVIQAVAGVVLIAIVLASAGVSDEAAQAALAVVLLVAVLLGYPVVSEWLCHGRTLGKLALGLRVVRDDGGPIGLRQALVRGLAGLVLEKPGLAAPLSTFAGMATIVGNDRDKRIGDLLAGTLVIDERAMAQRTAVPSPWVPPALVPWVVTLDLTRFDDRLAHVVRSFVTRAWEMSDDARAAIGKSLRAQVLAVIAPQPPDGVPTAVLLQAVLTERRRRADLAVAARPSGSASLSATPAPGGAVGSTGPPPSGPPPSGPPPSGPPDVSPPWSAGGQHAAPWPTGDEEPAPRGGFTPPS